MAPGQRHRSMSVSIATETGLLSRIACSCLKLDCKGGPNTRGVGYSLDRAVVVVVVVVVEAGPLQALSRDPSP
jgi:hypothetical protein